jgi:hypothetical protein
MVTVPSQATIMKVFPIAAALIVPGVLASCSIIPSMPDPTPNVRPVASTSSTSYGVPTSRINDLKLFCRLTPSYGLLGYSAEFYNPTPYTITVHGYKVVFRNANGTTKSIRATADFEISGGYSVTWPDLIPDDLTYQYNGTDRTVVTSCQVSQVRNT